MGTNSQKIRFKVVVVGLTDGVEIDLMTPPVPHDQVLCEIEGAMRVLHVVTRTIYAIGAHPDTGFGRAGVLHCVLADG